MPLRKPSCQRLPHVRTIGASRFALQMTLIICLKLAVLSGIWFAFIRGHKVPHDIPATTRHMLSQQ